MQVDLGICRLIFKSMVECVHGSTSMTHAAESNFPFAVISRDGAHCGSILEKPIECVPG